MNRDDKSTEKDAVHLSDTKVTVQKFNIVLLIFRKHNQVHFNFIILWERTWECISNWDLFHLVGEREGKNLNDTGPQESGCLTI